MTPVRILHSTKLFPTAIAFLTVSALVGIATPARANEVETSRVFENGELELNVSEDYRRVFGTPELQPIAPQRRTRDTETNGGLFDGDKITIGDPDRLQITFGDEEDEVEDVEFDDSNRREEGEPVGFQYDDREANADLTIDRTEADLEFETRSNRRDAGDEIRLLFPLQ